MATKLQEGSQSSIKMIGSGTLLESLVFMNQEKFFFTKNTTQTLPGIRPARSAEGSQPSLSIPHTTLKEKKAEKGKGTMYNIQKVTRSYRFDIVKCVVVVISNNGLYYMFQLPTKIKILSRILFTGGILHFPSCHWEEGGSLMDM